MSSFYLVVLTAMRAALSSSLAVTFRLLDTVQCKTKLDLINFKVWKISPCNQGDAVVQLITEQLLFVTNLEIFTSVWKHLFFCQQVLTVQSQNNTQECEQKHSMITFQSSLQKHCYFPCIKKGMLICFSGCLSQRFIAGIVKLFVQRHIFSRSPPGRRPSHKQPVNISHRSRFVKNVSFAVLFASNGNSYTE